MFTREQLMQKVLSPRRGSAMPGDLARHFQREDFANLIAYLESLFESEFGMELASAMGTSGAAGARW